MRSEGLARVMNDVLCMKGTMVLATLCGPESAGRCYLHSVNILCSLTIEHYSALKYTSLCMSYSVQGLCIKRTCVGCCPQGK